MNRHRSMLLGAPLTLLLLLAACGRLTDSGSGDGRIEHPTGPNDLILRVDVAGGFVPQEAAIRQFPQFSLYGDGRLITEGPQIEIYPPPALPSLLVRHVSEDGIQAILRAARDAGLFAEDRHLDYPLIADAATTTFTLVAEGQRHVISAYALGLDIDADQAPISQEDRQARRRLAEYQTKLSGLETWLPEGSLTQDEQFEFARLALYAQFGAFPVEPDLEQPTVRWPLAQPLSAFGLPADGMGEGYRCGVVEGGDLEQLLTSAREANQLTPWESEGDVFGLIFRPLLPDESRCPSR